MSDFRPLFVFGIARSGTNLVAGMLNAHRDVKLALDPLMPFFKALRSAMLNRRGDRVLIDRFPADCAFQDGYFDLSGVSLLDIIIEGDLNIPLSSSESKMLAQSISTRAALESSVVAAALVDTRGDTFEAFLHDLLERVCAHHGRLLQWCGTKEVWTAEFIPAIAKVWPEARFVVVRRDPRSVLASLIAMLRIDPSQAAHTVSYMRHWRKEAAVVDHLTSNPLLKNQLLIARYEDLASDPMEGAKRLHTFLDLTFDGAMLTPVTADGAVSRGNSSFGDIDGISRASVEHWRQSLDAATVKTIECHCGIEMLAEGYALDNAPPVMPDAVIARVVSEADRVPGHWRSDSGQSARDLDHEARRWAMLQQLPADLPESEVRQHFLFTSFFEKLRGMAARCDVAAIAQGSV